MAEHGLRQFADYHPATAFAALQLIEVAAFAGLSAALVAATVLVLRHRVG